MGKSHYHSQKRTQCYMKTYCDISYTQNTLVKYLTIVNIEILLTLRMNTIKIVKNMRLVIIL